MDYESPNTKLALIRAAGEMFADHGYDGVSTRAIAEKAGVNLGGIHYHFGGKERLYIATFEYAIRQEGNLPSLKEMIEQDPSRLDFPESAAALLLEHTYETVRAFLGQDEESWQRRLVVRHITNPATAMPLFAEEVVRPDHDAYLEVFRRVAPHLSEQESHIIGFMMGSQVCFHVLARDVVKAIVGAGACGPEFIEAVARNTARAVLLLSGLPMPEELR